MLRQTSGCLTATKVWCMYLLWPWVCFYIEIPNLHLPTSSRAVFKTWCHQIRWPRCPFQSDETTLKSRHCCLSMAHSVRNRHRKSSFDLAWDLFSREIELVTRMTKLALIWHQNDYTLRCKPSWLPLWPSHLLFLQSMASRDMVKLEKFLVDRAMPYSGGVFHFKEALKIEREAWISRGEFASKNFWLTPTNFSDWNWNHKQVTLRAVICGLFLAHSTHLLFFTCWPLDRVWALAFLSGSFGYLYSSEYLVTAIFNRNNLSHRSFIMDISPLFTVFIFWLIIEHLLILCFWPNFLSCQSAHRVAIYGLFQWLIAEILRKSSMIQLGGNFKVEIEKNSNKGDSTSELVSRGIYSLARHPSYVANFLHVTGLVLVLRVPVCFVLFVPLVWLFFARRISKEEKLLVQRFKGDYEAYRARVPPVFIPCSDKHSIAHHVAQSLTELGEFIEQKVFMSKIRADALY